MPVTTIAPLSAGGWAWTSPGAVAGGKGALGSTGTAWSEACASACDGKATANKDEQHPPARSQAVRERSERLDKFSLPSQALRRSSLPRFHTIIWKRFHFGASKAALSQAE